MIANTINMNALAFFEAHLNAITLIVSIATGIITLILIALVFIINYTIATKQDNFLKGDKLNREIKESLDDLIEKHFEKQTVLDKISQTVQDKMNAKQEEQGEHDYDDDIPF